jgi:hypothetical protein
MLAMIASPTGRPLPNDGCRCMRRPGAALISTMPPPCSRAGAGRCRRRRRRRRCRGRWSVPQPPPARQTSGWTSSVTSVAVPPVDRLALLRRTTRLPLRRNRFGRQPGAGQAASATSSRRMLVSEVAWPSPRRGSLLTRSTSWRMLCTPSPMTSGGSRRAAAISGRRPPAADSRGPAGKRSTSTSSLTSQAMGVRRLRFARGWSVDRDALALVAILRLDDHRTADFAGRRPGVLGVEDRPTAAAPERRRRAAGSCSVPCPGRWIRRRRWCGRFRRPGCGAAAAPAELHHAAFGQPAVGNVARHGGIDDRAGARAEAHVLVELAQAVQRVVEVEGVSSTAARQRSSASSRPIGRPPLRCIRRRPDRCSVSVVCAVRLKVTGQPACACRPSAANSSAWAIDTASSCPSGRSMSSSGKRSRKRFSKPACVDVALSPSCAMTIASIAVCRLQRLGPRRARIRETSMNDFLFTGSVRACRRRAAPGPSPLVRRW